MALKNGTLLVEYEADRGLRYAFVQARFETSRSRGNEPTNEDQDLLKRIQEAFDEDERTDFHEVEVLGLVDVSEIPAFRLQSKVTRVGKATQLISLVNNTD